MHETNKLKAVEVDAAIAASADNDNTVKLSDGESLYLVARRGFGFWSYQYRDPATGMLKTKGLGPYDRVTLKQARQLWDEVAVTNRQARRALKAGATLPAPLAMRRSIAGAAVQGTFAGTRQHSTSGTTPTNGSLPSAIVEAVISGSAVS